jgi:hypothetical protein
VLFLLCSFVVLTCVEVVCLHKIPVLIGCTAVLSLCRDYEYSARLVPLFKKGTGVLAACYLVKISFKVPNMRLYVSL